MGGALAVVHDVFEEDFLFDLFLYVVLDLVLIAVLEFQEYALLVILLQAQIELLQYLSCDLTPLAHALRNPDFFAEQLGAAFL